MNILFLTRYDPSDINTWSGTLFHIYNKLKEDHHVIPLGMEVINQLGFFTKDNFQRKDPGNEYRYIKIINKLLSERINKIDCDLIFFGDLYFVPFLEINKPIIRLSDVTYHSFKEYLDVRDAEVIKMTEKIEKKGLEKYDTIIYSSEWMKKSTTEYYNILPDKVHVVEFGANIPNLKEYTINIDMDICRLVFIGRNWEKKGGNKVLEAYKKLKTDGFPCTLTIIGCMPNVIPKEKDLIIIPFLDKSRKRDMEKLCQILSESHFLVLPTEYDAFGIVFCEASAYAVPSIAANVGGVNQPVREGKNGYLLPLNATADDYAGKIKSVFTDKESYLQLRKSSRHEFETRLNWDVWKNKVNEILKTTVKEYEK